MKFIHVLEIRALQCLSTGKGRSVPAQPASLARMNQPAWGSGQVEQTAGPPQHSSLISWGVSTRLAILVSGCPFHNSPSTAKAPTLEAIRPATVSLQKTEKGKRQRACEKGKNNQSLRCVPNGRLYAGAYNEYVTQKGWEKAGLAYAPPATEGEAELQASSPLHPADISAGFPHPPQRF